MTLIQLQNASPIIPISNNVFLGTSAPNPPGNARYKISVSKDTESQDYPVEVLVVTPSQKVGVSVGSDLDFTITSQSPELNPDKMSYIEVTYRNDGSVPVYGAEVRISAVDPFTSADDLAYLGDMQSGERNIARFGLTLSATADTKMYGFDSEVQYRDTPGDSHVSESMTVPITVVPCTGFVALISHPVVTGLIMILILGGAYDFSEYRRRQQDR